MAAKENKCLKILGHQEKGFAFSGAFLLLFAEKASDTEICYCFFGDDRLEWVIKVEESGASWRKSGSQKVISMFMGEYNHTIDAKGRLIVPAKFRELLGDEFVVTRGLDGCLFVYPKEEWKAIEAKFREVSQFSKDARKFARFFFAGAAACEVDKQGRILLPSVLREFAGIQKEVVLAGVVSRIEIWSKDRWQAENGYDGMEEVAEHMASLGLMI